MWFQQSMILGNFFSSLRYTDFPEKGQLARVQLKGVRVGMNTTCEILTLRSSENTHMIIFYDMKVAKVLKNLLYLFTILIW